MQSVEQTPHTITGYVLSVLALLVTGGGLKALFDWFSNRRKSSAEVVEINARSVKIRAEARQLDSDMVIRASERIEELLEINSALHNELIEANRRLDNSDFELRQAQFEMAQMQTRSKLREHLIEQLQAASKLGVKLSELPPQPKTETDDKH